MTEYYNEFIAVKLIHRQTYYLPIDENIISVYIKNNNFNTGAGIVINGFNKNSGLILYAGNDLLLKGKENEIFNGKLYLTYATNPTVTINNNIAKVILILKRKINDKL
jgi:hypothetical protein